MSRHPGEFLFREGMKYDLNQDKSLSSAAVARAAFQQAAAMGHPEAIRAFAHLVYEGTGGPKDQTHALLLLWSCFRSGELDALEELIDMLQSFTEQVPPSANANSAASVAQKLEQLKPLLDDADGFMRELARERFLRLQVQSGDQADRP